MAAIKVPKLLAIAQHKWHKIINQVIIIQAFKVSTPAHLTLSMSLITS